MIAFAIAMGVEAEHVRGALRDGAFAYKSKIADVTFATSGGKDFLISVSGIGKANAAAAAALLVNNMNVDLVVSIGTCGAIDRGLAPTDAVLAATVRYYDVDVTAFKHEPGQIPNEPPAFVPAPYQAKEVEAALEAVGGYAGKLALGTADVFLVANDFARYPVLADQKIGVVDMEAAACAQVCAKNGTPFVAVKVVADRVLDPEPNEAQFDRNLQACARKIADIVRAIVAQLG